MEIKIRRMKKLRLYLILIYLRNNWPATGDYDMNDLDNMVSR